MTDQPNSFTDPGPLGAYSDAARRIADSYALHLVAAPLEAEGKWMSFALEDGRCDPTLYDNKADAILAKGIFAKRWGYVQVLPMGMNYQAAESFLRTARMVADNPNLRWRQTDASAPSEHIETNLMPLNREGLKGR